MRSFFCQSNFMMSLFNIATWLLTELIPYTIIFCLNLSNFRQMSKQDDYVQDKMRSRYRDIQGMNGERQNSRDTMEKNNAAMMED